MLDKTKEREMRDFFRNAIKQGKHTSMQLLMNTFGEEFVKLVTAGYSLKDIHKMLAQFNIKCSYQTFRKHFKKLKNTEHDDFVDIDKDTTGSLKEDESIKGKTLKSEVVETSKVIQRKIDDDDGDMSELDRKLSLYNKE